MLRKVEERQEREEVGKQWTTVRCRGVKQIRGLWQRQIFVAKLVSNSRSSFKIIYILKAVPTFSPLA